MDPYISSIAASSNAYLEMSFCLQHKLTNPISTTNAVSGPGHGQSDLVDGAKVIHHETEPKSLGQNTERTGSGDEPEVRNHKSDGRSQAELGCQEMKLGEEGAGSTRHPVQSKLELSCSGSFLFLLLA